MHTGLDSPPRDAETRRAMEPIVCKLSSLQAASKNLSRPAEAGGVGSLRVTGNNGKEHGNYRDYRDYIGVI